MEIRYMLNHHYSYADTEEWSDGPLFDTEQDALEYAERVMCPHNKMHWYTAKPVEVQIYKPKGSLSF
tara:strand:- start:18 stop:218 length:201 start_codon:yes stop_codon:yes gene_type:complete